MDAVFNWLAEPFTADFMRNAFASVAIVGIACAMLGCYVILRRSVFITAALSHTILPGITAAAMLGISLYWGALASGLATALGVGLLAARRRVSEDAAIGVVLSFMFALGILLMTATQSFRDFSSLLFGSVLGVTTADLLFAAGTAAAVAAFFAIFHAPLKLATFDPEYARLSGARPRLMHLLFLVLVALAAVSSVRIIGALLTSALLVIPAAAANLLVKSVGKMIALAACFAVISGVLGLYASYWLDNVPAGAAIVIAAAAIFGIAWIFRR